MGRFNILGGQNDLLGGDMPTQLTCYFSSLKYGVAADKLWVPVSWGFWQSLYPLQSIYRNRSYFKGTDNDNILAVMLHTHQNLSRPSLVKVHRKSLAKLKLQ